jgi:alkylated DNA nucleotide flippase Atl1
MEIIQQMSIDARLISDRMAVLPEGAIITYETIESVAGRNREKLRGAITTALREQLRQVCMRKVYQRGVGYQGQVSGTGSGKA